MPSNKSYAVDERYDPRWNRFSIPCLKLFCEGLELAEKIYRDKHEIRLTLESIRRNRTGRADSDSLSEAAINQELWDGIAEVGRLRRGLDLFLSESKFRTRPDRTLAQALHDSLKIAEQKRVEIKR